MGLHAYILEPRRRAHVLLPLRLVPRLPRPLNLLLLLEQQAPGNPAPLGRDLPLLLLDLGHLQQPEKHIPGRGARCEG